MVKGLVELHGGGVTIASGGRGRGTEVTITLPRQHDTPLAATPSSPPNASRRRILVIEDTADAADMLREALCLRGHEVAVAYDGMTGLSIAQTFAPEIVICDIGLPGMDGYAVARAFRADEELKDVYLVALTGYTQPEDLRRGAEAGFNRHLAKPSTLEQLTRVLAEAPTETYH